MPPALEDTAYLDWYVSEVLAARTEFETASSMRLKCADGKSSEFCVGGNRRVAQGVSTRLMSAKGVLVRDRSSDPVCDGRVRITIGTREQMRKAVVALNEVLADLKLQAIQDTP